jgi:sulfatase maturation enzyme AslB (radical SAM superfamily)
MDKKMKLSQVAFIVTDACNFYCSYCPQDKESTYMKLSTIDKAIPFFYPYLDENAVIVFFGGEPLLAFDTIEYAVSKVLKQNSSEQKQLSFSVTTNGSLITDEILEFFQVHRFSVLLSYDGLAQEMGRKKGTGNSTRDLIHRITGNGYVDIEFSTNSVFSPDTIGHMAASMQHIVESGVKEAEYNLTLNIPWDDRACSMLEEELEKLSSFLVSVYKETGTFPVRNFSKPVSSTNNKSNYCFVCAAGRKRMAVTPGEEVWGCSIFHDYMKNRQEDSDYSTYSFGTLDDFITNHETLYPRILENHFPLRQSCYSTESNSCFLCKEVNSCTTCPISAAYVTSSIGKLPAWVCRMNGIKKAKKQKFLEEIDNLERQG